jgi:hypothetical protein
VQLGDARPFFDVTTDAKGGSKSFCHQVQCPVSPFRRGPAVKAGYPLCRVPSLTATGENVTPLPGRRGGVREFHGREA